MKTIYESNNWISDLDETLSSLPEIEAISNKRILVTGGTGLIGSSVVDLLLRWNEKHINSEIKLVIGGRSKERIIKRFGQYTEKDWFTVVPYDATSTDNSFSYSCDYVIHCASNASPNKIVKEPVETMMSNIIGIKYLLDYAITVRANRVVFISSSEVYGNKEGIEPYKANQYGYIDLLNARNSYSVGKRAAETLCASYADEYGVDSVIVRPGHIYGPTATESDNRVSSEWAVAAARGEDIVMKSDGSQIRSYCYCLDNASAILKILLKGESVHAYNVSNPESVISIREMAMILAQCAGVNLKMELPTEAEKKSFNPMSNSSLDSTELLSLGWRGLFDANRGFSHTVRILRELL